MQGLSWSIGMDEGAQTLPNFIKKYNPNIVGGSLGHHLGSVSEIACYTIALFVYTCAY